MSSIYLNHAKSIDSNMYFCEKCRKVWQYPMFARSSQAEYYNDFPSYGKARRECPKCNPKNRDRWGGHRRKKRGPDLRDIFDR